MPDYPASYDAAFKYLLVNEGTAYTNLAADRGGPTRYGIVLVTLAAWRASRGAPAPKAADVQNLSQDEAQAIYKAMYWDKLGGDRIADAASATALFDTSVLTGTGRAAKAAQSVLNSEAGAGLLVDGNFGAKSLAALNACPRRPFLTGLVDANQDYFLDIVIKDPTQAVFHRTWRRRAADYLGLVP